MLFVKLNSNLNLNYTKIVSKNYKIKTKADLRTKISLLSTTWQSHELIASTDHFHHPQIIPSYATRLLLYRPCSHVKQKKNISKNI